MTGVLPFELGDNPNKAVLVPQSGEYGKPAPSVDNMNKLATCVQCLYYKETSEVSEAHAGVQGYGACNVMGLLIDRSQNDDLALAPACVLAKDRSSSSIHDQETAAQVRVGPLKPQFSGEEVAVPPTTITPPKEEKPAEIPVREVTDADIEKGIASWEPIPTPKGGKRQLYIPVFADHLWSDTERDLIPRAGNADNPVELYIDHADALYDIVAGWGKGMATNLLGDAGAGKSELGRYLAYKMQVPYVRQNFTEQSEKGDIIGFPGLEDGETVWHYGPIARAFERPCVMLLDEINVAPSVVGQTLRPALDGARSITIVEDKGGVTLTRHEFCFIMAASNPPWDPRYRGTQDNNAADNDRMRHVWLPYPPLEVEKQIISSACEAIGYKIPKKLVNMIMKISDDIRRACDPVEGGELDTAWGVRANINAAKMTEDFELREVYRGQLGARLEPAMAEVLDKILTTYLAGSES